MQISISGATGFIGSKLTRRFIEKGWTLRFIDRPSLELNDKEFLDNRIEGSGVVINLAGAPILKKWNENYKNEIYHSRIDTTHKIATAIRNAVVKPSLFISSSAIGIYDQTETHTEESTRFAGDFMAKVCMDWEQEALTVIDVTRVVIFRTGVVLDKSGGALDTMYKPFSYGMGGTIGNGKQHFSWISLEDLLNAFLYAIENKDLSGIVNAVALYPTTNRHFTETFGKVLNQPALLRIPKFGLKLAYGEGAQALISGQRVIPEKLLKSGFEFTYPTIEKALMAMYR
jgi:uncharacterized protein